MCKCWFSYVSCDVVSITLFSQPVILLTTVCAESLLALEHDIETVHPQLLGDAISMPQICRLLEHIGVRRLTAADVIHHHILPTLRSPSWHVSVATFCMLCVAVEFL